MLVFPNALRAETVTLQLRNGDRITGEMLSLDTDHVTITNALLGKIVVPVAQVERMEKKAVEPAAGKAPTVSTNAAPPAPTAAVNSTNPPPAQAGTTAPKAAVVVAAKPAPVSAPPVKPKPPKHWNLNVDLGSDLEFNQTHRELYYGRAKWTYGKDRFRSIVDFLANYGETDGIVSANDMNGSVRLELDVDKAKKVFLFNATGIGYNRIQKIDLNYDDSLGLGYKLVARTNLTFSVDGGVNYQRKYFSDGTTQDYGALRVAEQLSWKITPNGKWILDEKYEFYPRVTSIGDYRMRFETNLRYLLSNNLNLNLTLIDQYDTQPAVSVSKNDLLLRATIGIKF